MSPLDVRGRLSLIEDAFRTLADCAQELRDVGALIESEAITSALASIGGTLMSFGEYGVSTEERALSHWKTHARIETKKLVRESRMGQRITAAEMRSIFHKPRPEL